MFYRFVRHPAASAGLARPMVELVQDKEQKISSTKDRSHRHRSRDCVTIMPTLIIRNSFGSGAGAPPPQAVYASSTTTWTTTHCPATSARPMSL